MDRVALYEARDLKPTLDTRSILKAALAGTFDLTNAQLERVFPNSSRCPRFGRIDDLDGPDLNTRAPLDAQDHGGAGGWTVLRFDPAAERLESTLPQLANETGSLGVMIGRREADRRHDPAAIPTANGLHRVDEAFSGQLTPGALKPLDDETSIHIPVPASTDSEGVPDSRAPSIAGYCSTPGSRATFGSG